MEPVFVFQALMRIWDELPTLLGSNWATIFPNLQSLLERLAIARSPSEQKILTADLMLLFSGYTDARVRLQAVVGELKKEVGYQVEGSECESEKGVTGGSEKEIGGLFDVVNELNSLAHSARYANTCLTNSDRSKVIQKKTDLSVNQKYALRLNIGFLSPDSVVENAKEFPFPSELLPESGQGHWLEVVADSDDFIIDQPHHTLFLPKVGKSWICNCSPGSQHSCGKSERQDYLFIPIHTPPKPGKVKLRLALYYQNNLVQSQLVTAQVAETEGPGLGYSARIDYTLSSKLDDLSFLPLRALNILTNKNLDGTHRIIVKEGAEKSVSFNLSEKMESSMNIRETLRQIHYKEGGLLKIPYNLYDDNNAKPKEKFIADLERLAEAGWGLWCMLFADKPISGMDLKSFLLANPAPIQVSRVGGSEFIFPWMLVYEIQQDSSPKKLCPLVNQWDGKSPLVTEETKCCPYEDKHDLNTLCPFGFWGYRYIIEQPPSVPDDRKLPQFVQIGDLDLLVACNTQLNPDLSKPHLEALGSSFKIKEVCTTKEKFAGALGDPNLELVYFYCHGDYKEMSGGLGRVVTLLLGEKEALDPKEITAWFVTNWPKGLWPKTDPLIFINGCHTVEVNPDSPVNFVDAFAGAYAGGVIGTEITINQRIANEVAEIFFKHFRDHKTVGEAIRLARMAMLAKGNLMGLVYTPYCSVDLKLALQ